MMLCALCALTQKHFGPFMPQRGSYFLLLVQKKVTQEKDTPLTAPCGGPLRCSPCRAAAQLARFATRRLARTSARRHPPTWLCYSAVHRGPEVQHQRYICATQICYEFPEASWFYPGIMTTDHQIETHIPRLRRYARALTGDTNRADDLVQDTLERAWTKFTLWRSGSDLRAWLFSIMHNVHINQLDYRARRKEEPMPDEPLEIAVAGHHERQLEVRDLASALAQLPTEYREVLLLVGLEELKYEEVAKVLNIPIGTVMSRLARGRERLRLVLSGSAQTALRRVK